MFDDAASCIDAGYELGLLSEEEFAELDCLHRRDQTLTRGPCIDILFVTRVAFIARGPASRMRMRRNDAPVHCRPSIS
ncbi:MAG TPA: hypothetical protein VK488_12790 [Gaiellaceae bacterium]|nr:hypothetical protein [Gaiellaceae bacterium]